MILYIFVTLITIFLAYMYCRPDAAYENGAAFGADSRARRFKGACLVAIFTILFLLSAFRINVGNDYGTYVEFMHRLYTDKYIADAGVPTEWGFNLLARVIYALSGGENYILVFAIYAFVTILFFLMAIRGLSVDFGLSFLLFMTFGYYFQSFSTVRYYMALAIALYAMKLVGEKRWVPFVIMVLLGSGFHKSLLVILPLYFLASFTWKKWGYAILLVAGVSCIFLKDIYMKILVRLYPSYEGTEYLAGSGFSWINIIRCVAVLALSVYCYRECVKDNRMGMFYFQLNIGALALYLFGSFLPIVSRIGYYLTVSHIVFVPMLIHGIKNVKLKKLLYAALIVVSIMYFALYLHKAYDDGVLVLPYKTFFFNDMVNTLSDVM
ncbi:EpsG family protein [Lachnospiraceae bacterium XBB2008]|nr:EpsG family protein [Lachnospiraceae bacterium XBB2008]